MDANWMWFVLLAAAMAHALRWVPADATSRSLKMAATFAFLYVVYAVVVSEGGPLALVVAFVIVEIVLHLYRRRRAERTPRSRR